MCRSVEDRSLRSCCCLMTMGNLLPWRGILWRTIYRRLWRLRSGLGLVAAQAITHEPKSIGVSVMRPTTLTLRRQGVLRKCKPP